MGKIGKLKDAHVMVVGCGALGNEVLKNLALCGIGHLTCVDFDRVEESNLPKSVLFRNADVSRVRYKVEVVKERLQELAPDIDIVTICADITADVGLGYIMDSDVVVSCVDNRWARFMINRHCNRLSKPWVDGGISQNEGTARVFIPGHNCYACSLGSREMAELKKRISCSNSVRLPLSVASAPTNVITASIAGAVQAQEAIKLICGGSTLDGKMFHFDSQAPSCGIASFPAYDEECPEHDRWYPIEKTVLTNSASVGKLLSEAGDGSALMLREDCFVDFLSARDNAGRKKAMVPSRRIPNEYAGGGYYQNEFRIVDGSFPYPELSLEEIGIPGRDIIRIMYKQNVRYLELAS